MDSADIRRMFSSLAPEYDRFNRWSSAGLDGIWRRRLTRELYPNERVLDLGCGTGELAKAAYRAVVRGSEGLVVGLDFSRPMLVKAAGTGTASPAWLESSAQELPFRSEYFDAVVSAYVMRNLQRANVLEQSLKEAYRVLRRGGRLLFLDLTRPRRSFLNWGHRIYLRTAVSLVGRALFKDRWPGAYLDDSIEALWPEERLQRLFESIGFRDVSVEPVWGGIVSIFRGGKAC